MLFEKTPKVFSVETPLFTCHNFLFFIRRGNEFVSQPETLEVLKTTTLAILYTNILCHHRSDMITLVNARNNQGFTPLMTLYVQEFKFIPRKVMASLTKLFLKYGADPSNGTTL
jgi:hypothetical protein